MIVKAYRIAKTERIATAFDGEGAWRSGGRWNSKGTRVVYTASSLSLALLEVMAHLDDYRALSRLFSYVSLEIPSECIVRVNVAELPTGWNTGAPSPASTRIGDEWAREGTSAALEVPSAVVPGEVNFVLNPLHSDFPSIAIGDPVKLSLDPRLERP